MTNEKPVTPYISQTHLDRAFPEQALTAKNEMTQDDEMVKLEIILHRDGSMTLTQNYHEDVVPEIRNTLANGVLLRVMNVIACDTMKEKP